MSAPTIDALRRWRGSGRKLILVTGRQLDDLESVFPDVELFDMIVAENGAVLHSPAAHTTRVLCASPPPAFVNELARRGVSPLSVGAAIVSTQEPHEITVLEVVRELGLELQVTFNKGAVMVLPSGVNKATGLDAALRELGLSAHNTVAAGDAENDHAFLDMSELAVAVANALPALQERADLVTVAPAGAGVAELVDQLLGDELATLEPRARRPGIGVGYDDSGQLVHWPIASGALLIAGSSAGGKTTLAAGLLERVAQQGYQFCVIDPEGDHAELPGAVVLGSSAQAPTLDHVLELLRTPDENVVVNLLGVRLDDRPLVFRTLLGELLALRARTGRPHFLMLDEAHHLMPGWSQGGPHELDSSGLVLITVHPERVASAVLGTVGTVAAVGERWSDTLASFATAAGPGVDGLPELPNRHEDLQRGTAVLWSRRAPGVLTRVRTIPPEAERRRHVRKYAAGELDDDRSFYFRGPDDRLNLRAQNLNLFVQISEGLDDPTWLWHLRRGDYARWFEQVIKDDDLAAAAAAAQDRDAGVSRSMIRAAIEQRYTASA